MERSLLRQMIAVVSRPDILSFAGGLPAPELFPTTALAEAATRVLAGDPNALQYRPPFGPLKAHIVALMARRGVTCREEQVFITTGAQQALDVLTRLLLNPGGQVMLEESVYPGIQQVVAPLQPDILTVPTDLDQGLEVDAVAEWLRDGARPAFLYTIPEAHNPLGVSMSGERRRQLVALAQEYGLPLIEDDPYAFLCYDGRPQPPLRALNDEMVFYVGSFSKILAPAIRLGWLVAPEALTAKITVVKEAADLESSAFIQRIVAQYLDSGELPGHVERLCQAYGERRDAMLESLDAYFPGSARWTRPQAGMFLWVELPECCPAMELLNAAIERERVAFIPGNAFAVARGRSHPSRADHVNGAGHCLRLNFSNCSPERIRDGIRRLGQVVAAYL
jgi:2-aminoadipate transaminase